MEYPVTPPPPVTSAPPATSTVKTVTTTVTSTPPPVLPPPPSTDNSEIYRLIEALRVNLEQSNEHNGKEQKRLWESIGSIDVIKVVIMGYFIY